MTLAVGTKKTKSPPVNWPSVVESFFISGVLSATTTFFVEKFDPSLGAVAWSLPFTFMATALALYQCDTCSTTNLKRFVSGCRITSFALVIFVFLFSLLVHQNVNIYTTSAVTISVWALVSYGLYKVLKQLKY